MSANIIINVEEVEISRTDYSQIMISFIQDGWHKTDMTFQQFKELREFGW